VIGVSVGRKRESPDRTLELNGRIDDVDGMYTEPCALHTEPYALHTEPYALYTEPYALYTEPYALHTEPYALHTEPYALYTEPYALNTGRDGRSHNRSPSNTLRGIPSRTCSPASGRARRCCVFSRVQFSEKHMKSTEGRAASALTNSAHYLDNHPDALGELRNTPARQQLDRANAAIQVHRLAQETATRMRGVHATQQQQLTAEIRDSFMKPIAAYARKSLRGSANFAALTASGRSRNGMALVTAARSMATAAAPLVPHFTEAKFPPDVMQQLAALADQLETSITEKHATKADRVVATDGIVAAVKSGRDAVAMLDPVVTRMLRSTELLAGWKMVKRTPRSTVSPGRVAPATPVGLVAPTAPEVAVPSMVPPTAG
jgi:hypothetical protein